MATLETPGKDSETYVRLGLVSEINTAKTGSARKPGVLSLTSSVLERSIQKSEERSVEVIGPRRRRSEDAVTIFDGTMAPSLSVGLYLERIFRYSSCSNSCFVVALIYMDRFLHRTGASLTSLNVHRLVITSVMVAAKFMDDECYNNAYYAKIGGVSTAEINRLEVKFLYILDFRLHVTKQVFDNYCFQLQKEGTTATNYRTIRAPQGPWPRQRQVKKN